MRAFLINPWTETISVVDDKFDEDFRRFYHHLTEPEKNDVSCFCTVALSDMGDVVFVDDEGMLAQGIPCFTFRHSATPLAGRGLVVGTDDDGEVVEASRHVTLDWLRQEVVWLRLVSTGKFGPPSQAMVNHPVFGRVYSINTGQPILDLPE